MGARWYNSDGDPIKTPAWHEDLWKFVRKHKGRGLRGVDSVVGFSEDFEQDQLKGTTISIHQGLEGSYFNLEDDAVEVYVIGEGE